MKKNNQLFENNVCRDEYYNVIEELNKSKSLAIREGGWLKPIRLRTCKAWVYETDSYYILQSYSTIVAAIDKRYNVLYDFLRVAYGYTATSAQHIAKFSHDYSTALYGCQEKYTWRSF